MQGFSVHCRSSACQDNSCYLACNVVNGLDLTLKAAFAIHKHDGEGAAKSGERAVQCGSTYLHEGTHGRKVDSFHRPRLQVEVTAGADVPAGIRKLTLLLSAH